MAGRGAALQAALRAVQRLEVERSEAEMMDMAATVTAGPAATPIMTAQMYLGPVMGMPRMDMIGMLGTMFTANKRVV